MKKARAIVSAGQLMSKPVKTVSIRDSIRDVARLFVESAISAAAVLDDRKVPIGVITKTDLVRFEAESDGTHSVPKKNARSTDGTVADEDATVEHWMTPVIFAVTAETPAPALARKMVKYGTHHIFVRRRDSDDVLGIVSSFDLLRALSAG